MSPATVQAVCDRGRDGVRTTLKTPHTNARAVCPYVEDRILRLRKNLTKQGFDAGAETIAAHPQTHHQRACGIHDLAHPDR